MNYSDHARCPSCSGNMIFNIGAQKLVCSSCSRMLSPDEYELIIAEKKQKGVSDEAVSGARPNVDENDGFASLNRSYTCSSCGGEINPGALGAADFCPFCGNAIVFTDKYREQRMPDFILPFIREKSYFIANFRKRARTKYFVPDSFIREAVPENVRATYVPFWLYDVKVSGEADYQAEKVERRGFGKYSSYEHQVYQGHTAGSQKYLHVPQDGSSNVDDRISQALEPYPVEAAQPFSFAWLSGLNATIYNMDSHDSYVSIRRRVTASFDAFLSDAKNFTYTRIDRRDYKMEPLKVSYALFPIWTMDLVWNNVKFRFAMNGQTGKSAEEFPISWGKFFTCQLSSWFMASSFGLWLALILLPEKGSGGKEMGDFMSLMFFLSAVFVRFVSVKYLFTRNLNSCLSCLAMLACSACLISLCLEDDYYKSRGRFIFDMLMVLAVFVFGVISTSIWTLHVIKKDNAMEFRRESNDYVSAMDNTVSSKDRKLLYRKSSKSRDSLILKQKQGWF